MKLIDLLEVVRLTTHKEKIALELTKMYHQRLIYAIQFQYEIDSDNADLVASHSIRQYVKMDLHKPPRPKEFGYIRAMAFHTTNSVLKEIRCTAYFDPEQIPFRPNSASEFPYYSSIEPVFLTKCEIDENEREEDKRIEKEKVLNRKINICRGEFIGKLKGLELFVFICWLKAMTNDQIADSWGASKSVVKSTKTNVIRKYEIVLNDLKNEMNT